MANEEHAPSRPHFEKPSNAAACLGQSSPQDPAATSPDSPSSVAETAAVLSAFQAIVGHFHGAHHTANLSWAEGGLMGASLGAPVLWAWWRRRRKKNPAAHSTAGASRETEPPSNDVGDRQPAAKSGGAAGYWGFKLANLFVWPASAIAFPAVLVSNAPFPVVVVFLASLVCVFITAINAARW